MKVFISFSGERSKAVAKALHEWLKNVLQALEPWFSEEIAKGKRWSPEIAKQLDDSKFGIVCLTPENLKEPWINFEAGACSKSVKDDAYVVPYLHDVGRSEVVGPLADFQMCEADEKGTSDLVHVLNKLLIERGLSEGGLAKAFQLWWPDLHKCLSAIPKPVEQHTDRDPRELLEEILERQRQMERMIQRNDLAGAIAKLTEADLNILDPYGIRFPVRPFLMPQVQGINHLKRLENEE